MERRLNHSCKPASQRALIGLLLAMGLAATAGTAGADTATVTINGTIDAGTCSISVGDVNKNVTLATIKTSDLPASGAAALQNVTLTVDNCDAGLSTATFTFTGTSDATDLVRWQNTGTAQGVAVELESSAGVPIGANATNNVLTAQITGGQAVLTFQAGYWHLPSVTATAGSVSAVATVNTSYN
ncbi:major type 1 subunit fimbrin (pilin) [Dyella sp. OK004]|uniref:fimbrial protein n=1 Tax=Dyella sp. OK004 TaxID=1855292 RepID=UPI0008E852B8|nr:fimbrial protein [Dyella sp. OK004]SFR95166.1 major type 1 subunit fimbrin (pilin) [Dyella sp. OK004]